MKKVAIIAYNHSEASLCLAKYIAKQGVYVDFYYLTEIRRNKGYTSGFEYKTAPMKLGILRLASNDIPEIAKDTEELPVRYHLMRVYSFSKKFYLFNQIVSYLSCRKIKKEKYDAINLVGHLPWTKILHDCLKGENLIHTLHEVGSHQDGFLTTPLLDTIIRDGTKIILPSKSTYSRFLSIKGSEHIKSCMIPVGKHETLLLYDREEKIDLNLDLSKVTFLFYGYIRLYKGIDVLAEAMKMLQDKSGNFNLIVAGQGTDSSLEYLKTLANCRVINRFLTNEEMVWLNKVSTVIVLPYKSASQSGIVLTSFLYGKPIIATKVGALVETIENGKNGILVEPDNPKQFAEAMEKVIDNPPFLEQLHRGALDFGNGDAYDWNIIAKNSLDFFFS